MQLLINRGSWKWRAWWITISDVKEWKVVMTVKKKRKYGDRQSWVDWIVKLVCCSREVTEERMM